MIRVYIPPNNIPEKKYIVHILFSEFLGLEYSIEINNSAEYLLKFSNSRIVFEDSFWGKNETEDYLRFENIPQKIGYLKDKFTDDNGLPILYGSNKTILKENIIVSGLDIFASSFFMLTRWEEFANQKRDSLGRFQGSESVAYKNNFINRPIVNEYAEYLWNLLKYLGYNGERSKRAFKIIPTVDVDHLFIYNKNFRIAKRSINVIKKDESGTGSVKVINKDKIKRAVEYLSGYLKVKLHYSADPYDNYDRIMNSAEKINTKVNFFFLSGKNKIFDSNASTEDYRIKNIIDAIKSRGHNIGFHPGFDTYNDSLRWKEAKNHLDEITKNGNNFGRQHYLRFDVPKTWQIWEENNMAWDSTLGYPTLVGFRCGSCYEYSVFDIVQRKQLKLKEFPLLIMDVTFLDYLGMDQSGAISVIKGIKDTVKKYNGNFVFLWHNSSFNLAKWKKYENAYEELWN